MARHLGHAINLSGRRSVPVASGLWSGGNKLADHVVCAMSFGK